MYILVILLILWGWIVYEFYRAPLMDDDGNIINDNKNKKK
jgi:hypothetical protein